MKTKNSNFLSSRRALLAGAGLLALALGGYAETAGKGGDERRAGGLGGLPYHVEHALFLL